MSQHTLHDEEDLRIKQANEYAALRFLEKLEQEEKDAGVYVEDWSKVFILPPGKKLISPNAFNHQPTQSGLTHQ